MFRLGVPNVILLTSQKITSDASKVTDTNGREFIGGGDILKIFGAGEDNAWKHMNGPLINNLNNIGLYKVLICILIIVLVIIFAVKLSGRRAAQDRAIKAELENISNLRKRDAKIIRYNKWLSRSSKVIHGLGLDVSKIQYEYLEYNLKRAGINTPGGQRTLNPNEFNALTKLGAIIFSIVSVLIIVFVSTGIGTVLLIVSLVAWNTVPMMILRDTVSKKDNIIKNNFFNFYEEIYYVISDGGGNKQLNKVIRSYNRIAPNAEMERFASNCADLMDLYGEVVGSEYISREYREIEEVGKLMRLIRQFNDNATIQNDLDGFREQLFLQRQFQIDKHGEIIEAKALRSFAILMVLLVQAVISAIMIYLPDLAGIQSFF